MDIPVSRTEYIVTDYDLISKQYPYPGLLVQNTNPQIRVMPCSFRKTGNIKISTTTIDNLPLSPNAQSE